MNIFKLGEVILDWLNMVFGFWNNQVGLIFELLGQSPISFKSGTAWAIVERVEPIFVSVGCSLVVLFFVMGFCAESINIRDEMRFENILRMLIRLVIAEWLVMNNITFMKAFFQSIGNLVGLLGTSTFAQLSIASEQAEIIKNLGFGQSILFLILAVLLSFIIVVCGFFMLYTVYFRFLRIMLVVPFGALAYATLGSSQGISQTALQYTKYFISVVLEAVTMVLAILLCNAFINAGLPSFTGDYADWAKVLIYLGELTFTVAITTGAVKGAQTLTSRMLGL